MPPRRTKTTEPSGVLPAQPPRTQTNRNLAGTAIGLVMTLFSGGIANSASGDIAVPRATSRADAQPLAVRRAVNRLLQQIPIRPEAPRVGYSRTKFPHWVDEDGDGCDTRQQVLIIESEEGAISDCVVTDGVWRSIYDDKTITSPGDLDIDHLVALGEAWDSAASTWDPERRRRYANDLGLDDALIAVSKSSNRSKSDRDPAEWKPNDQSVWCRYATSWTHVKIRWGLSADEAEIEALRAMLRTCRSRPATSVEVS